MEKISLYIDIDTVGIYTGKGGGGEMDEGVVEIGKAEEMILAAVEVEKEKKLGQSEVDLNYEPKKTLTVDTSFTHEHLLALTQSYKVSFIAHGKTLSQLYHITKYLFSTLCTSPLTTLSLHIIPSQSTHPLPPCTYLVSTDPLSLLPPPTPSNIANYTMNAILVVTGFYGYDWDSEVRSKLIEAGVDPVGKVHCLKQLGPKLALLEEIQKDPKLLDGGLLKIGVLQEPRKTRKMVTDNNLYLDSIPSFYTVVDLKTEKDYNYDVLIHKVKLGKDCDLLTAKEAEWKSKGNPILVCNAVSAYPIFKDRASNIEFLKRTFLSKEFDLKLDNFKKTHPNTIDPKTQIRVPTSFNVFSDKTTQAVIFINVRNLMKSLPKRASKEQLSSSQSKPINIYCTY